MGWLSPPSYGRLDKIMKRSRPRQCGWFFFVSERRVLRCDHPPPMASVGHSCIRAKALLTTDAALWLGRSPADATPKIGHFSAGNFVNRRQRLIDLARDLAGRLLPPPDAVEGRKRDAPVEGWPGMKVRAVAPAGLAVAIEPRG